MQLLSRILASRGLIRTRFIVDVLRAQALGPRPRVLRRYLGRDARYAKATVIAERIDIRVAAVS